MSERGIWLLILVLGIGTFLLRVSFIQLGDFAEDLPDGVEEILELIPVAVLAALVFPRLFLVEGAGFQVLENIYLLTGVLSGMIAWWSKNLLLTVVFGMVLLWTLQNVGVIAEHLLALL